MTPIAPAVLLAEIAVRQQHAAEEFRSANGPVSTRATRRFHVRRPRNTDRVA